MPIILAGLKRDLREHPHFSSCCVDKRLPMGLRDDGTVEEYIECSAKDDGLNIKFVVEQAIVYAIRHAEQSKAKKKKCSIL